MLSERNNPFVSDVKISSSVKTDDVDNVKVNSTKISSKMQEVYFSLLNKINSNINNNY